jgi:Holliday junction resolvase
MSNYSDGYRFECKVRDALREDGYEVLRSAGSKTKIDLVALKPGEIIFVQCKLNGVCTPAERSKLRDLAGMAGALPIVAYSHKDGRAAAVVRYRLLTGDGPRAYAGWTPDQVDARLSELLDAAQAAGISSVTVSG